MELTNQTVPVSSIVYRLSWTTAGEGGYDYISVSPPQNDALSPNFLDDADDFARAWAADVLSNVSDLSHVLKRVFFGAPIETAEVDVTAP